MRAMLGFLRGSKSLGASVVVQREKINGTRLWHWHRLAHHLGFHLAGEQFRASGVAADDELGDHRRGGFFERLIQAGHGLLGGFAVVFEDGLWGVGEGGGGGKGQQKGGEQVFHGCVVECAGTYA